MEWYAMENEQHENFIEPGVMVYAMPVILATQEA
jgi:hypothetical protein